MKNLKTFLIILISPILLIILKSSVFAAPIITHDNYQVDIYINQDSTFEVEEKIDLTFDGYSNGLSREITLDDPDCNSADTSLTCGGFEFLVLQSVSLNGEELQPDEYEKAIVEEEEGPTYFRIRKRIFAEETYVTGYKVSWSLRYKIYGGIQWRNNVLGGNVPFFYWNTLPETSNGIEKAKINIHFPDSVKFDPDALVNYSSYYSSSNPTFSSGTNTYSIDLTNVLFFEPVTFVYEFGEKEITKTQKLQIINISPQLGIRSVVDGEPLEALDDGLIEFMPAGEYEIKFVREGYIAQTKDITIKDQDVLIDVNLEPEEWMRNLILLLNLFFYFGLGFGVYYTYMNFRKINVKSKDAIEIRTIVPKFKPPEGVQPYMLGSLIDEEVEYRDVTGTIIDLAYRGFIKIKDLGNKDYELTLLPAQNEGKETIDETKLEDPKIDSAKPQTNVQNLLMPGLNNPAIPNILDMSSVKSQDSLSSKDHSSHANKANKHKQIPLNESEQSLIAAIFGSLTTKKISAIKVDVSFFKKIKSLIKAIYDEMVFRNYFKESPEKIRNVYTGKAMGYIFMGIFGTLFISFFLTTLTGFFQIFTIFSFLLFSGIVNLIMAGKMPAKTELGSKVYGEILGFKMYLETAERFRLQNLEPKDFEKYLSYAVVLGLEKQWAEKFKDIYIEKPEWYEGTTFNPVLIGIFTHNFSNSFSQTIRPVVTSSSASGGGWKGGSGSSFGGGFSGGGGGGGRSGGW